MLMTRKNEAPEVHKVSGGRENVQCSHVSRKDKEEMGDFSCALRPSLAGGASSFTWVKRTRLQGGTRGGRLDRLYLSAQGMEGGRGDGGKCFEGTERWRDGDRSGVEEREA